MDIQDVISRLKKSLFQEGVVRPSNEWQGVEAPDKLLEIFNKFVVMAIPYHRHLLAKETQADLPWAENHFLERVSGKPLNPGNEYKNWPYYREMDNDKLFRNDREGDKFSHTYMERMWCSGFRGIGYPYGDFENLINRIIQDPYGRQHYFAIWHPEDQSEGSRRRPCTIGYWFYIEDQYLHCTYHIRSCDILRHLHNDIYLTGRLMQYIKEELSNFMPYLTVGDLHMWIGSLHCFESEKNFRLQK